MCHWKCHRCHRKCAQGVEEGTHRVVVPASHVAGLSRTVICVPTLFHIVFLRIALLLADMRTFARQQNQKHPCIGICVTSNACATKGGKKLRPEGQACLLAAVAQARHSFHFANFLLICVLLAALLLLNMPLLMSAHASVTGQRERSRRKRSSRVAAGTPFVYCLLRCCFLTNHSQFGPKSGPKAPSNWHLCHFECMYCVSLDACTTKYRRHQLENAQYASRAGNPPVYCLLRCCFLTCHSFSWLSRVPVRRYMPLGENLTKDTGGFSLSIIVAMHAPSSMFHSRHSPS